VAPSYIASGNPIFRPDLATTGLQDLSKIMAPNAGETIATVHGPGADGYRPIEEIGHIQVLHVDDEPDFASMAAEFLRRHDDRLDVETATDASEALDRLESVDVDCIVSDYDMPGENGIEFLQAVREDHPDLPFILFTGKGSEEIASRAISEGVTEYLQKGSGTSQYAVLANRITNAVEQYQARHAFEASQKRLSLFIEQSPIGVIEWDEDFEFRRMNEKAEEILGYTESDLVGRSWEAIVPDTDREPVSSVVSNLLEDQGGYHSINDNVRSDGDRITCEWHNRVITETDGSVVAIFSQFQDITERREGEQQLARQRAILEAQRESVLDGQLLVDEDGAIVSYNEQFVEMWGLPDDIVERGDDETALEYVTDKLANPDEFREKVEYLYDHREETARDEVELLDGRVFDRYTTPLVGEGDTYFGRLWTFRDITDRDISEVTGVTPYFVDAIEDYAIFMLDADGCVATWNSGAERIKGYSEREILGSHYRTFFSEEAVEQGTPEQLLDRAEGQGSVSGRGWRVRKDGSRFWAEFSLTSLYDESGDLWGFAKVMQDTTAEHHHVQQLERENEALADRAKEVSHDIKNPLSVALGRLELAREEVESSDLDVAAEALDRSLMLVNELLSQGWEEVDAGDVEVINLAETAKWCWRTIETANETLVVETEQTIRAVPTLLNRLLSNLLANAVEHGGDGVTVTVGDLEDGFYVADSGSGIPEDERELVFSKEFTNGDGVGLGLHIVQETVEAHGWSVRVTESEAGGARLEITGIESPDG